MAIAAFNHIIGLPVKPSTGEVKPIFPYESDLTELLSRKKRLAILKATGLGITECITIRWLIWKCVVNSDWSPIYVSTTANHDIYFDSKSTILQLNGCTINGSTW